MQTADVARCQSLGNPPVSPIVEGQKIIPVKPVQAIRSSYPEKTVRSNEDIFYGAIGEPVI